MSDEQQPHSVKGPSSAERWLNCGGSTHIIQALKLNEGEDTEDGPEYRREGTAAHALATICLRNGQEPWEYAGLEMCGAKVNPEMVEAVQTYVDVCRGVQTPATRHTYIEQRLGDPAHPEFFGTLDFAAVGHISADIVDFKYGRGIRVGIEWNPQLMCYAYLLLMRHPEITQIGMRIVQPRLGNDGSEHFFLLADAVRRWADEHLLPVLMGVGHVADLVPGEHCRFCPAKLHCPALTGIFEVLANAKAAAVKEMTPEILAAHCDQIEAVNIYIAALKDERMRRLSAGDPVPRWKLVALKANRVYRAGVEAIFREKFGKRAYSKPELLSPAQMEKLGDEAAAMVAEHSYKPDKGFTCAPVSDPRPAIVIRKASETFASAAPAEEEF